MMDRPGCHSVLNALLHVPESNSRFVSLVTFHTWLDSWLVGISEDYCMGRIGYHTSTEAPSPPEDGGLTHGPLMYKDATRNSQVYHWCSIYIDISIVSSNCYPFKNNIDMRILMGGKEKLSIRY